MEKFCVSSSDYSGTMTARYKDNNFIRHLAGAIAWAMEKNN